MKLAILAIFSCLLFLSENVFSGDLIVIVDRFTEEGNIAPVKIYLCDSEENHSKDGKGYKFVKSELMESTSDFNKYKIRNLSPGEYSISIFQDINNSGKLERSGFLGIPKEPVGFSMLNLERIWRFPRWDEVKFVFEGNDMFLNLHLIYKFGFF